MSEIRKLYEANSQGQVFEFYDSLTDAEKTSLEKQASAIDLNEIADLTSTLTQNPDHETSEFLETVEPADYVPLETNEGGDPARWVEAQTKGEEALRAGRVAAFTVAGGQGTRLGYNGPKGTFGVSPILKKSLFQIFAEKILASSKIFGHSIPWFIMTSQSNHDDTIRFFEQNHYFGLSSDQVTLFSQGVMPAVDEEGKILLEGKSKIALSPDGHGGSLRALVRSGATRQMEAAGIDIISYFQVDNPLVRCIDPAFIGFHLEGNSELSSKMVTKAYASEKVGVFCQSGNKTHVVEYSDLPNELAEATDANGKLLYRSGSIAVHLFNRDFVDRIGSGTDKSAQLPFHLANKKVPFIDSKGNKKTPKTSNAYKFEMFVFDALPFANNPVIIETAREDDFSPVKNAEGIDSAQSSRDDQLRQFARWAASAGIKLETNESGIPAVAFEISPLFGDTAERFASSWDALENKTELTEGIVLA